jgi:thymidine phosphorylase
LVRAVESGAALERFARIAEAQGGPESGRAIRENRLPEVATASTVIAGRAGHVAAIDAQEIGLAALALGAGRARKEDAVDPAVGLELLRKVGEPVARGEPLVALQHREERGLGEARKRVERAYRIAEGPPPEGLSAKRRPLVLEVLR